MVVNESYILNDAHIFEWIHNHDFSTTKFDFKPSVDGINNSCIGSDVSEISIFDLHTIKKKKIVKQTHLWNHNLRQNTELKIFYLQNRLSPP